MSTKIYDAYKYHGKIEKLPQILSKLIEEFINGEEYKKKLLRYYHPFSVINMEHMGETVVYIKDIDDLWKFNQFFDKKEKEINSFIEDFDMSATVHFDGDDIYCMFFNLPYKLIDNHELFSDFHYQDQSDMSNYDEKTEPWEKMSKERQQELEDDWDNRRDTWDRIFTFSWSPKTAGLSYDMSPFGDFTNNRKAFNIFNKTLNDPVYLRKLKIRRLYYVMNHKKNVDKIISDGGKYSDIRKYVESNNLKWRDLEGWELNEN